MSRTPDQALAALRRTWSETSDASAADQLVAERRAEAAAALRRLDGSALSHEEALALEGSG